MGRAHVFGQPCATCRRYRARPPFRRVAKRTMSESELHLPRSPLPHHHAIIWDARSVQFAHRSLTPFIFGIPTGLRGARRSQNNDAPLGCVDLASARRAQTCILGVTPSSRTTGDYCAPRFLMRRNSATLHCRPTQTTPTSTTRPVFRRVAKRTMSESELHLPRSPLPHHHTIVWNARSVQFARRSLAPYIFGIPTGLRGARRSQNNDAPPSCVDLASARMAQTCILGINPSSCTTGGYCAPRFLMRRNSATLH